MLSQDELYCIALILPCHDILKLMTMNKYYYHYFNRIWEQLIKRDFKIIITHDFQYHYKKLYLCESLAWKTHQMIQKQYICKLFILPLRNINRYDWLPSFFIDITKYEPSIMIKYTKDEKYKIILIKTDYELYYEYKLTVKKMIKYFTILFYKDPYIKFTSHDLDVDKNLTERINYIHHYLY